MYKYISEEGLHPLFYFTTKYGLKYVVSFHKMDFDNIIFKKLYSIDFYEVNNQKFFTDASVELTITTIINNYFKYNPDIILNYVCDSIDFKQDYRKKLFDKWYRNTDCKEFSKINFEYISEDDNLKYYLSFIFKSEYYYDENLIENINLQLEEFSGFK